MSDDIIQELATRYKLKEHVKVVVHGVHLIHLADKTMVQKLADRGLSDRTYILAFIGFLLFGGAIRVLGRLVTRSGDHLDGTQGLCVSMLGQLHLAHRSGTDRLDKVPVANRTSLLALATMLVMLM